MSSSHMMYILDVYTRITNSLFFTLYTHVISVVNNKYSIFFNLVVDDGNALPDVGSGGTRRFRD